MTWSKFDDAAAKNPKSREAGNEAWALWVAAVMYCNRHLTDGLISLAALANDCLPRAIPEARAKKLAEQLCECSIRDGGAGLFERAEKGKYRVHDFLEWNLSKDEVEARRKTDRDRKRGKKDSGPDSGGTPSGIPSGIQPDSDGESARPPEPTRASARALPVPSRPVPSEREEPPTPKPRPRDPMGESLRGTAAHQRADVLEVHARWRTLFGLHGHTFRGYGDIDAQAVAEAIDSSSLETCLRVLEFAPKDGMVSGRDDERRVKHDSLRYIFGNAQAFARILRAADEEAPANRESTVSRIARLKQVDPGAGAA